MIVFTYIILILFYAIIFIFLLGFLLKALAFLKNKFVQFKQKN